MEPSSAEARVRLGMANAIIKNHIKASKIYEEAMKLDPEYPNLNYLLALSYYISNKYNNSIPLLKHAINLNSRNGAAHHLLGLIYLKQDRYNEAIIQLQKALTINPKLAKSST
jgi:tetratricopeptide (TPR) repeat protein